VETTSFIVIFANSPIFLLSFSNESSPQHLILFLFKKLFSCYTSKPNSFFRSVILLFSSRNVHPVPPMHAISLIFQLSNTQSSPPFCYFLPLCFIYYIIMLFSNALNPLLIQKFYYPSIPYRYNSVIISIRTNTLISTYFVSWTITRELRVQLEVWKVFTLT